MFICIYIHIKQQSRTFVLLQPAGCNNSKTRFTFPRTHAVTHSNVNMYEYMYIYGGAADTRWGRRYAAGPPYHTYIFCHLIRRLHVVCCLLFSARRRSQFLEPANQCNQVSETPYQQLDLKMNKKHRRNKCVPVGNQMKQINNIIYIYIHIYI